MTVASAASSLAQALLAALGPSQNQRLLRLQTPLGPDVLLAERMLGMEAIGPRASAGGGSSGAGPAGFRFEVLALSTNAHLALKQLVGQPVRLDLLTQQSREVLRPFHGHVTAFALLGSDGGLARYKLTIEPWLAFLGHGQDAWVFQDQTVMQIVDEVFADYQGQGRLAPAWRWELADPAAYPRRSLCIQYHETDLAFVQRLLAEEGLFCWFEHAAAQGGALGSHTLVIADHNACFKPNVQPRVRFTQSAAASFREDSLDRFEEVRRVASSSLASASWDHRSVQQTAARAGGDARLATEGLALDLRDQPGAYAYEDSAQAQRIVSRQLEALQAPAWQCQGQGGFRQAACATLFQVAEHPSVPAGTQWVTLAVQHRARNNITAELSGSLQALLGRLPQAFAPAGSDPSAGTRAPRPSLFKGPANQTDEPLYQARLLTQDAGTPVRAPASVDRGNRNGNGNGAAERGDLVFTRPHVPGVQTAIVVGLGEPVHTDRDNRIKIQFHWQRGNTSAHRLAHTAGSNAPGDDGTGTWVRVAQAWSGANWGGHFTPRLGQEVLVAFVEGDIDRPVVIGSAYNGQGSADAQGNQVAAGAATATGNAGPWFPGQRQAGEFDGHRHAQVLGGFKSQSLEASQSGSGGYNQLVFDDTPAQARTVLGSTTAATWLQLGHLLHQDDNQRLAKRGHGLDLSTSGHGALRAGAGLHLSGYARAQGTQAGAQPAEARAALSLLEQAAQLTQSLGETAQKHNAKLSGEARPADMPVRKGWDATLESLGTTDTRSSARPAQAGGDESSSQGLAAGSASTPAAASPLAASTSPAPASPASALLPASAGAAAQAPGSVASLLSSASAARSSASSLIDKARSAAASTLGAATGALAGAAASAAGGISGATAALAGASGAVTQAVSSATGAVKLAGVTTGLGEAVDKLASASPSLQGQLSQLQSSKWQFDYGSVGGGSFADRDAVPPTITLDGALKGQAEASVQTLAHEAGHATYGYVPDLSSRSAYVDGALADEGAATLSNIRAQREILSATGTDIGLAGDSANHAAYNAAFDKMLGGGSEAAARAEIGAVYAVGEHASVPAADGSSLTYRDYYGNWYDANHGKAE